MDLQLRLLVKTQLNISRFLSTSSVLNGTPKRRVSVEMRIKRKYGEPNMITGSLMLNRKRNILVCHKCGSYHEARTICNTCYDEVRKETLPIIESIRSAQKNEAVTKEVVIQYKDEQLDPDIYGNVQIVETERLRPMWFANNLLKRKAIPGTNKESDAAINDRKPEFIKVVPDTK